MKFIFGGAYQGKREYAIRAYGIKEEEIYECPSPDDCATPAECIGLLKPIEGAGSCKVVACLENFTLACARQGLEPAEYMKKNRAAIEDKILILTDVSQGIVPLDMDLRMWRDCTGRMASYLAQEAETVVRIFCGLPQILK